MPTVAAVIRKPNLEPWADGVVTFRPSDEYTAIGNDLVRGFDIRVTTDAGGWFVTELAPGYYWVWIGSLRPFVIQVPSGEGVYLLKDLVSGGSGAITTALSVGDNYVIREGSLLLLNGSTGTWHPVWWSTATGGNAFAVGESGATYPSNYQIASTCLQLFHDDTEEWHAPGINELYQLFQGEAAEVIAGNYRIRDRMLQIANLDLGSFHTIYLYGPTTAMQLAVGPAVS